MSDINAWSSLHSVNLEPWEVTLISKMDDVFVAFFSRDDSQIEGQDVSERPLSPALFDAMFPGN